MEAALTRFIEVLRDGFATLWLAPTIALVVILPEMIQHAAEIRIGMFESREAFKTLADDPRRMVWGILKIVGLVLAFLATIRFWSTRESGGRWWDLRTVAWKNVIVAIILSVVVSTPGILLEPHIGKEKSGYMEIVLGLATLPLLALLVAGLVGHKDTGLVSIFKTGWLTSLRILIFATAVWVPLEWLHNMNHEWAMGQADFIVWLLMIFDSLVVGLLAMLVGTAFHHGYMLSVNDTAYSELSH